MIIVHYNNHPLFLYPAIAKRLNLTHGQILSSQTQFVEVLKQNATHYALVTRAVSESGN